MTIGIAKHCTGCTSGRGVVSSRVAFLGNLERRSGAVYDASGGACGRALKNGPHDPVSKPRGADEAFRRDQGRGWGS